MKFSIIIPAYNSAKYIENGLKSIANQTYNNYELIVVCDSCTDNTEEIARSYGAEVIPAEFHNDGLARSAGLDAAKGTWVMFMDDDDWWLHEYVLEQLSEKLEHVECDVLAFSFIFKGVGYAKPRRSNGEYWIAVWSKVWRRECIQNTRFPNVPSISDRYFHNEMIAKGLRIEEWDMPMYYYNYLRQGSISHKLGRTAESTKQFL